MRLRDIFLYGGIISTYAVWGVNNSSANDIVYGEQNLGASYNAVTGKFGPNCLAPIWEPKQFNPSANGQGQHSVLDDDSALLVGSSDLRVEVVESESSLDRKTGMLGSSKFSLGLAKLAGGGSYSAGNWSISSHKHLLITSVYTSSQKRPDRFEKLGTSDLPNFSEPGIVFSKVCGSQYVSAISKVAVFDVLLDIDVHDEGEYRDISAYLGLNAPRAKLNTQYETTFKRLLKEGRITKRIFKIGPAGYGDDKESIESNDIEKIIRYAFNFEDIVKDKLQRHQPALLSRSLELSDYDHYWPQYASDLKQQLEYRDELSGEFSKSTAEVENLNKIYNSPEGDGKTLDPVDHGILPNFINSELEFQKALIQLDTKCLGNQQSGCSGELPSRPHRLTYELAKWVPISKEAGLELSVPQGRWEMAIRGRFKCAGSATGFQCKLGELAQAGDFFSIKVGERSDPLPYATGRTFCVTGPTKVAFKPDRVSDVSQWSEIDPAVVSLVHMPEQKLLKCQPAN